MSLFTSLFGKSDEATKATSVLDMVTKAAGLASNPRDIDPLLDKVRIITSRLHSGESPTGADEATLLGVYLQLELYLTTKEPIRTFTKEELRARISKELRSRLETYERKG